MSSLAVAHGRFSRRPQASGCPTRMTGRYPLAAFLSWPLSKQILEEKQGSYLYRVEGASPAPAAHGTLARIPPSIHRGKPRGTAKETSTKSSFKYTGNQSLAGWLEHRWLAGIGITGQAVASWTTTWAPGLAPPVWMKGEPAEGTGISVSPYFVRERQTASQAMMLTRRIP